MAELFRVICPECAKQFQVPDNIVGRKIRCKGCGKTFVAKPAEEAGRSQKKPDESIIPFKDDDEEDDGRPYEVTSLDLAPRCPSCANELESEDDVVCLHCGFNLRTRTAIQTRRIKDVTGGKMFLWLLPGILSAVSFFICLGLFLLAAINRLFFFEFEPNTEQMTKNCANCCVLWWCIWLLYLMYQSGKFAIRRLIFNNQPPEEEA